jgi:hypothetical protein
MYRMARAQSLHWRMQPGRSGGYVVFPHWPEFYVRRGATTFWARVDDVASAYGHTCPSRRLSGWQGCITANHRLRVGSETGHQRRCKARVT